MEAVYSTLLFRAQLEQILAAFLQRATGTRPEKPWVRTRIVIPRPGVPDGDITGPTCRGLVFLDADITGPNCRGLVFPDGNITGPNTQGLVFPGGDITCPNCRGLVFPDGDIAGPDSQHGFETVGTVGV